jgi:hypothetical protein
MKTEILKSAAIRAARTFLQVFLTVYLAGIVGYGTNGSLANLLDLTLLDKAAFAGMAALLSFLHRAVLDPSPLPSLPDVQPPATAGLPENKK